MNGRKEMLLQNLSFNLRNILEKVDEPLLDSLEEIRLRRNKPLFISSFEGDGYWSKHGEMTSEQKYAYHVQKKDIDDTLELMSQSSIYAFVEEIKKGFLTIKGGNRVGLCGRVVLKDGEVINITDISAINIRLAKQVIGAADPLMKEIFNHGIKNTLIISPPKCGKTTLLRDIARQLGNHINVGIVDERGELAACFHGEPQLDVGQKTDVLDLCPKHIGMLMLLRSMAPQVIITDEIATEKDMEAMIQAVNSGVGIIASAHGSNIEEVQRKMPIDVGLFERIIILSRKKGAGTIEKIVRSEEHVV